MPTHQGGGARFFGDLASTPSLSTRGYDKSKLKLPIGRPSPKARPPMTNPDSPRCGECVRDGHDLVREQHPPSYESVTTHPFQPEQPEAAQPIWTHAEMAAALPPATEADMLERVKAINRTAEPTVLAAQADTIAKLRAALRAVEWVQLEETSVFCPKCRGYGLGDGSGPHHYDTCIVGNALGKAGE